ncbi:MAG: hypothetical protein JWP74_1222 [Marmoricola sp.]|nr:hypothetical protein [Marmoricola sp.]
MAPSGPRIPHAEAVHAVLHCNVNTVDAAAAVAFYDPLGLALRMTNLSDDTDATPMGLGEHTASRTDFTFDARGPRAAPALELVEWLRPVTVAEPPSDGTRLGFEAIGIRLGALPAADPEPTTVRGRTRPTCTRLDPDGIRVDLVEIAPAPDDPEGGLFSHVRLRCSDLDRSRVWYERIGFAALGGTDATAHGASLMIPEDPTFSIELVEDAGASAPRKVANAQGVFRVALAVEDVRASYAALVALGADIPEPVYIPMPDIATGGFTVLFLADPDGIVIEMVERPRSAVRRPQQPAAEVQW